VTISISTTFADNLLGTGTDGVATQIGGGLLVMYASGGSPPAGPNEPFVGSTIATFTFSAAGSQGSPSGGVMDVTFASTVETAINTGTADYFRVINSSNIPLVQGSVGTSNTDWNLSSVSITSGDSVTITGTPTILWTVS
jgi:hypothetical protein